MSERTIEPTVIAKGERVEWQKTFTDYSAADYDLQYRLRGNAGIGVNVDATADGETFVAVMTAAQSNTLSPGRYRWQAWVTEQADADNTFIVGSGWITIEAGFGESPTSAVETRSVAKQIVDAIDAAILASGASDVIEYDIETPAGKRRVKRSKNEALAMRKEYAGIVARETAADRARQTGKFGRAVNIRVFENN